MVCSSGGGPAHQLRGSGRRCFGSACSPVAQIARFLPNPCDQHMSPREKRTLRLPKGPGVFLRCTVITDYPEGI
eukprot:scaffold945_cov82-Cylindrotheca_fusiformis.AAC.1